ncbi:MAG: trans-aconitate 2-methyltransferase [Phycisphaerae bacterium]|nr:class I SAM-dependent methyltransferase [Tepidisphaeraceae bacterium]
MSEGNAPAPRAPYDAIVDHWDSARAQFLPKERGYLDMVLAGAPAGAAVLDLGCGTGRPIAAEVVARGYRVIGVDGSWAQLDRARRHVPSGLWVQADLVTVELTGPFAAAICWDALFHVGRAHHAGVLRKLHRCLAPGGRVMISSGGSDAEVPAFTDTMYGHTFFYDAYTVDEMRRVVREAGFEVLLAELAIEPDGGRDKGKLVIVAAKR